MDGNTDTSMKKEIIERTSTTREDIDSNQNKMFEIVRSQRDRFRDRIKELENEKHKLEEITNVYKTSMTRLEQDNMQLYQKIRYLQSYHPNNNHSNSNMSLFHQHQQDFSNIEEGYTEERGRMDVENRYKNIYEEKMNPFAQFNKMETQQRYRNLNTVDKILLNSVKMFLGHRITRTFAFIYILLLHFLVFATLWAFMHGCTVTNNN
jgi:homeobox protein cut-like